MLKRVFGLLVYGGLALQLGASAHSSNREMKYAARNPACECCSGKHSGYTDMVIIEPLSDRPHYRRMRDEDGYRKDDPRDHYAPSVLGPGARA